MFGIVLPTWDVGSDIALSYSYFCTKVCTWDDYIWDYKNGVKPPVDQNIGESVLRN